MNSEEAERARRSLRGRGLDDELITWLLPQLPDDLIRTLARQVDALPVPSASLVALNREPLDPYDPPLPPHDSLIRVDRMNSTPVYVSNCGCAKCDTYLKELNSRIKKMYYETPIHRRR